MTKPTSECIEICEGVGGNEAPCKKDGWCPYKNGKNVLDIPVKQPVKQPECFGYYDDGNDKCEECEWSDMCFEKGVL